ncbi:MAG: DNA topoisomerase 3 [Nannocystis sp.]|uniref:DNA topoisomerase 3 n=1 Tax=Nannocystis sp. TaxID=1962667 RepID=UPI0024212441|nr:DNA topoisomerase 3 [Nannocystis sp.]MBK9756227.1 DNA topoisomerase 3 [Nannocystis sp.]
MTTAVIAEKPSVARDIAAALGATRRGEGCFTGEGYVVTWAIGHLVALAQPHEIDPAWKRWSLSTLPMLPSQFPLVVVPDTRDQFTVVRRVLCDRSVTQVICATDAGREGELIFRYIYEAAGCTKPVRRLWISSLTPDAIHDGLSRLRSSDEYDGLADAARGRSRADWLVGMNLSRAYSLVFDQDLSVGRVQTPTLAILVERELAIRDFVPEDYREVQARFQPTTGTPVAYVGTWFRAPTQAPTWGERNDDATPRKRLPADGVEAAAIVARALAGQAAIASVKAETRAIPPPLLYDLTELQRHANRLYGLSAQKTLDVAQALYERHKLISYPRTDSRHLSTDIAATLAAVTAAIGGRYPGLLAPGTGETPLGRRFVDDARVSDHHAILPTATPARAGALAADEQKIYDLICRRLLAAWHEDYVYSATTVITAITSPEPQPIVDTYESRGTAIQKPGWKLLEVGYGKPAAKPRGKPGTGTETQDPGDQALPAGLARGQPQQVQGATAVAKQTRPPPRHSEGTLLTAMETAGRTLEEKELSDALRDLGLGTPATRAQIIETLLRREYMIRDGKALAATDKGIHLISVVHPEVKSPAMTGEWEAKLRRMSRGDGDLPTFMAGIESFVRGVIDRVTSGGSPTPTPPHSAGPGERHPRANASATPREPKISETPPARTTASEPTPTPPPRRESAQSSSTRVDDLHGLLRSRFGFPAFRPHQEAVCRAATLGRDLLLVMPTGAGKSLCYQLPGIARGGTTLVISPLIALMEDQSSRLTALGLRSERIHSGRGRAESRQACVDYLAGKLDFLFIAPERLRVPGFPEMLARRTPALIAVDEAHCISQWGHDFRPDYRMLGQRLPMLRPAPIIALTATATPTVQDDIVAQLGLRDAGRFIHGFRRTNIAIEVLERNPGERAAAIRELLSEPTHRPAIVYAATRKSAESLARAIGPRLAAAYHAGMASEDRDRVQAAFLAGQREVIVATTAFGMGIDKADVRTIIHAALPGSLEGYYQEIGRAGRDGAPAQAILMHAYVDRKTHEFFHERDYPDPLELAAIHARLPRTATARAALNKKRSRAAREAFDKALEKLVVHGGAIESGDDEIMKGAASWGPGYAAQREHRRSQLEIMARFAGSHDCRMVHLIRHFGDQEDHGAPCGICDVCAPDRCIAQEFRTPSASEQVHAARILAALARADGQAKGQAKGQATGRLHLETFPDGDVDRHSFEHLLGGLVTAGLVTLAAASFTKRGKVIPFQRATLTAAGRSHDWTATGLLLPKLSAAKAGRPTRRSTAKRSAKRSAAKRSTTKRSTTKRSAAKRSTATRKRAPAAGSE